MGVGVDGLFRRRGWMGELKSCCLLCYKGCMGSSTEY